MYILYAKTHSDEEASEMSTEIQALVGEALQERQQEQHAEEGQELVSECSKALKVEPDPYDESTEHCEDGGGCTHSDRVGIRVSAKQIACDTSNQDDS